MVMQAKYFDGFDSVDSSHETTWYNGGNWTIASPGRFGVASYADVISSITKTLEGGPYTYMAAGRACRWTSVAGDDVVLEFGNGTQHCRLRRNSTGNFYISWQGGTDIYTGLTAQANIWYHAALAAKWNGTTGQMRAWINGNLVLNRDNIDTDNNASATPEFQDIVIGAGHVDDFYICAEDSITGSMSDEFLGDLIVREHFPQVDGESEQWTPLSGTDSFQMVDEIGPDNDTTYLHDTTPGNRTCFGCGTLSPDIAAIKSVQLSSVARFETTGPHSIKNYVRNVGVANHDQPDHPLTINYIGYQDAMATDPVTGLSWTKIGFEARQYGIKDES